MAELPDSVDDALSELTGTPSTAEVRSATRWFPADEIGSAGISLAMAGGGGGSLPAQWEADPDTGALTITLTGTAGDGDFATAVKVKNSDGSTIFELNSSGEVRWDGKDANATTVNVHGDGQHYFQVGSVNEGGGPLIRCEEPTDAALGADTYGIWLDPNTSKLMVKAKIGATIVTGEIPLT